MKSVYDLPQWFIVFIVTLGSSEVFPNQGLGEDIYLYGKSKTNIAYVGEQSTAAPANLFACANCHGVQAKGLKEGGISAPEITWFRLSATARRDEDGGQPRPAYDRQAFKHLLLAGIDTRGKKITGLMPRYSLQDQEIDALIRYLAFLDQPTAPGVSDLEIRIAVVLPADHSHTSVLRAAVSSYFNEVNRLGGIYGREIKPLYSQYLEHDSMADFFAVLAFDDGTANNRSLLDSEEVPVIALFSGSEFESRKNIFYLYSDPDFHGQALRNFADQRGYQIMQRQDLDVGKQGKQALLLQMGEVDLQDLIIGYAEKITPPILLIEGDVNTPEMLLAIRNYPGAIYAAVPPTPQLADRKGLAEYSELAKHQTLPSDNLSVQLWGITAAKVLTESLRMTGKNLHRQKLLNNLSALYDFETHYGPTLHFSVNRKVGAPGAAIVRLDRNKEAQQFKAIWITF